MPRRILVPLIGSLALVAGFAVAQGTGIRWLGGVVLVLAAVWCGMQWRTLAGTWPALACVAIYGVAFGVSHPLGTAIGAWPSVLLVTLVAGVLAFFVTGRRRRV